MRCVFLDYNIVFIVDFYNAFELSNGLWFNSSSVSSTKMRTVKKILTVKNV